MASFCCCVETAVHPFHTSLCVLVVHKHTHSAAKYVVMLNINKNRPKPYPLAYKNASSVTNPQVPNCSDDSIFDESFTSVTC